MWRRTSASSQTMGRCRTQCWATQQRHGSPPSPGIRPWRTIPIIPSPGTGGRARPCARQYYPDVAGPVAPVAGMSLRAAHARHVKLSRRFGGRGTTLHRSSIYTMRVRGDWSTQGVDDEQGIRDGRGTSTPMTQVGATGGPICIGAKSPVAWHTARQGATSRAARRMHANEVGRRSRLSSSAETAVGVV